MDAEYANYYTREVMVILIREFASPDEVRVCDYGCMCTLFTMCVCVCRK